MEISLGNCSSIINRGSEGPELKAELQKVISEAAPSGDIYRRILQSEVLDDGHILLANADGNVRISSTTTAVDDDALWLDVGCVSKLITAIAVLKVFGTQKALLDTRVTDALDVEFADGLSEITLADLVNHTHGIDEPQKTEVALLPDGRIDTAAILGAMGKSPLHRPGKLYSYACVGPWLLAAVLERKLGQRYIDIVGDMMPGILPSYGKEDSFCPALGAGIRINAGELLQFLVRETSYATPSSSRVLRLGPAYSIPYPGWHPHESAVCSGWKVYEGGWFGHQSIRSKTPLILRIAPADGIGIIVSSRTIHPWRIVSRLCSEKFVLNPRPPKTVRGEKGAGPTRDVTGTYERVDSRVEILLDGPGLKMVATSSYPKRSNTESKVRNSMLHPIGLQTFGVSWAYGEDNLQAFFEFIRNPEGRVTHLWNGALVWRKTS